MHQPVGVSVELPTTMGAHLSPSTALLGEQNTSVFGSKPDLRSAGRCGSRRTCVRATWGFLLSALTVAAFLLSCFRSNLLLGRRDSTSRRLAGWGDQQGEQTEGKAVTMCIELDEENGRGLFPQSSLPMPQVFPMDVSHPVSPLVQVQQPTTSSSSLSSFPAYPSPSTSPEPPVPHPGAFMWGDLGIRLWDEAVKSALVVLEDSASPKLFEGAEEAVGAPAEAPQLSEPPMLPLSSTGAAGRPQQWGQVQTSPSAGADPVVLSSPSSTSIRVAPAPLVSSSAPGALATVAVPGVFAVTATSGSLATTAAPVAPVALAAPAAAVALAPAAAPTAPAVLRAPVAPAAFAAPRPRAAPSALAALTALAAPAARACRAATAPAAAPVRAATTSVAAAPKSAPVISGGHSPPTSLLESFLEFYRKSLETNVQSQSSASRNREQPCQGGGTSASGNPSKGGHSSGKRTTLLTETGGGVQRKRRRFEMHIPGSGDPREQAMSLVRQRTGNEPPVEKQGGPSAQAVFPKGSQ